MAETLVENQVCNTCGVEIRPQALFCYNCGAEVAEEESSENTENPEILQKTEVLEEKKIDSRKARKGRITAVVNEKTDDKTAQNGNIKLKSAANLRNKARKLEPKRVEIIWEEHQDAPNLWFLGVAILLIIFAIVIFYLAMYLK